jgi:hypothetical protein
LGEHEYRRSNAGSAGRREDSALPDPSARGREPLLHVDPIPVCVRFVEHVTERPWRVSHWRPEAVEPVDASAPDAVAIEIFPDEAEGYYLNLTSGEPSIMVRWRLPEDESGVAGEAGEPAALAITLSYNEAGRWMDGGERVDRLPMPPEMCEWLAEFVRLHWRPETRHKQRGPKPSFMQRNEFSDMVERERQRLLRAQAEAQASGNSAIPGSSVPGSPSGQAR